MQNIRVSGGGGYIDQWYAPITSPVFYQAGAQNQFQAERPFYDSYNANDIRKAGTWATTLTYAGKTITWSWTTGIQARPVRLDRPVPRKYVDSSPPRTAPAATTIRISATPTRCSWPRKRVPARPTRRTPKRMAIVNQVRARAKVPNLTAGLSLAAFSDSLLRRASLRARDGRPRRVRHAPVLASAKARNEANMATIATANRTPFTSSVEKFNAAPIGDKWKLYPIPVHACELNSALTQNPGWTDGVCK
jgi:hypothetical protein